MEWPIVNEATGKPSTTPTGKDVWKAALSTLGESNLSAQTLINCIDKTNSKQWRTDYIEIVHEFVRIMASVSSSEATSMAHAGLDALSTSFKFRINNDSNETIPAKRAFMDDHPSISSQGLLDTTTLRGSVCTTKPYRFRLASPQKDHKQQNIWLTGRAATRQLETWANYGCMEKSAAKHASSVVDKMDVSPLVQDKIFVLLGATSSMGPAKSLLSIPGAHVLAVARDGKKLNTLKSWFERNCPESATLQVPKGGADMLKEGPQIARWVAQTVKEHETTRKQIVICHLAYLDGEAHVRVSVAMDLISEYVIKQLAGQQQHVSFSYLSSPATAYAVPDEYAVDAQRRYENRPALHRILQTCSATRWLQPTNLWTNKAADFCILNGLVGMQGPNYALAKTMQQWRCMVHWNEQRLVSAPMAPATRTESMVSYSTIAAAIEGQQYFEPLMTFDVDTTSSLMAAILLSQINQLVDDPAALVKHPVQITWDGSVHGGVGRCPYAAESTSTISYLTGVVSSPWCPKEALASVEDGDSEVPLDLT